MVFQVYIIVNFKMHWSLTWWSILMPLDDDSYMPYISVVPKPNKDPGEVDNYCLIWLIGNHLKLFTNVLANCHPSSVALSIRIRWASYRVGRGLIRSGEQWIFPFYSRVGLEVPLWKAFFYLLICRRHLTRLLDIQVSGLGVMGL